MAELQLAGLLCDGDLVVVAQGTGEPTTLLEQLVAERRSLPDVEVFVGLSHSGVLADPAAWELSLVSFGAMGPLRQAAAARKLAIIPCNFSDVPRLLELRAPGRLVVLVQVSAGDEQGRHSLGPAVDYTYDLLPQARLVIAEVNEQVPVTTAPRIDGSTFAARVASSRPVQVVPDAVTATDVQRRIAANAADLVPDGATIQLGIGGVPSLVGAELALRHGLRVHSTLAGNWLLDLAGAGALADQPDAVVISEAAGSPALYDYIVDAEVRIRSVQQLTRPAALLAIDCFVSMNSALEVDLTGQVNAEMLAGGYVAGIGGQPDYLRAAQRSQNGRSVVMLPATALGGRRSRIVPALECGAVTTPRSAVDFVVTEFGVADLRARSLDERADALIAVAAPHLRDALRTVEQNGSTA